MARTSTRCSSRCRSRSRALGLLMIYSSSKTRLANEGLSQLYYVERQSLAIVIGVDRDGRRARDRLPAHPRHVGARVSRGAPAARSACSCVGRDHKGAQAWFQVGPLQFQPSEIAKVVRGRRDRRLLPSASRTISTRGALGGRGRARRARRWRSCSLQHDLGTMLVILVCSFAVLVVAGLKPVHIGVLVLIGVTLVGAAVVDRQGRGVSARPHRRLPRPVDRATSRRTKQTPGAVQPDRVEDRDRRRRPLGRGARSRGARPSSASCPSSTPTSSSPSVGEELGFLGGATLLGALRRCSCGGSGGSPCCRPTSSAPSLAVGVLGDVRVPGVRERRDDDGDHADHGHPAALHVVRRLGDHRLVHRHRAWSPTSTCADSAERARRLARTRAADRVRRCPGYAARRCLTCGRGSNRSWPGWRSPLATSAWSGAACGLRHEAAAGLPSS